MDTMKEIWRLYRVPILLGGASLFFIILSIVLLVKSLQTMSPITFSSDQQATGSAVLGAETIMIDIAGGVISPGVYKLAAESRVEDAIVAAGGLSADVDGELLAKTVNRAMKLIDGAKIFIPSTVDVAQSAAVVATPEKLSQNGGLVSVNFATAAELESLSGIGPATATKIISGRPYQTLEELVTKKAMGTSLFEKLKNQVLAAQLLQKQRFTGAHISANGEMQSGEVQKYCRFTTEAQTTLDTAADLHHLSPRRYVILARVAQTIADMEQKLHIEKHHITEAMGYCIPTQ